MLFPSAAVKIFFIYPFVYQPNTDRKHTPPILRGHSPRPVLWEKDPTEYFSPSFVHLNNRYHIWTFPKQDGRIRVDSADRPCTVQRVLKWFDGGAGIYRIEVDILQPDR